METPHEHGALQETVRRFVEQELIPLEKRMLAREAGGGELHLTAAESAPLLQKCRELGLGASMRRPNWGGADLSTTALMLVQQELSRTVVPFSFPPESPVLRLLLAVANEDQRERYLTPYAEGSSAPPRRSPSRVPAPIPRRWPRAPYRTVHIGSSTVASSG